MSRIFAILMLTLWLCSCVAPEHRGTIGELRQRHMVIESDQISNGLEQAMAGYQQFLRESEDSALTPEAIRRLADLKIEQEYGHLGPRDGKPAAAEEMSAPQPGASPDLTVSTPAEPNPAALPKEEDEVFAERATRLNPPEPAAATDNVSDRALEDLERAGPLEAIALYRQLLEKYPLYERNDQVLYQMSRAYEELGRIEEAMTVMADLVKTYPDSRYLDEVQFRRAEFFFAYRLFLNAEEAYIDIVRIGAGSSYYPLALYKLGWTYYKQELYEDALQRFIGVLDFNLANGYDFDQTEDEPQRKRIEDTFRVISLSFSYLGGANSVVDYFAQYGQREYENRIYRNLGEYYFSKRRYSDAVEAYTAYLDRHPLHFDAPLFHKRIIEINTAGGFPSLVLAAKKAYATNYGLNAPYWKHFVADERPEVIAYLKENLTDLAHHYHALYQQTKKAEEKPQHLAEALHWYRDFLSSFPTAPEAPAINYQLADLLLENTSFLAAAVEYEKTAYGYGSHDQAASAGYAAVYAYRRHQEGLKDADEDLQYEIVRSSLTFAETFPDHDKAAVVMVAALDDLYSLQEFERAQAAGRELLEMFPAAAPEVRRSAWLVVAHSSYELAEYAVAESAYLEVLRLLPEADSSRADLVDNLAAAIYKQGEQARAAGDNPAAAEHFLRVGILAPTSKIRPTAEYDGAAALILSEDWSRAAQVLQRFRSDFPEHELQPEVTKKMAYVYQQDGKLFLAAEEYERIETESDDPAIRQDALLTAAELYEQSKEVERALQVYLRYVGYFPEPFAVNLEMHQKIAEVYKDRQQRQDYLQELGVIVGLDAKAGEQRTDRTRFLAGKAALVLAEVKFAEFKVVRLVKPFKNNLKKKQTLMKAATSSFNALMDYEIGEVTAAATYYLAEIYGDFSKSLLTSERPEGLSALELEDYELAIEEQAYPFEERGIQVHQSNLELIALGVYNSWVEKSLARLAILLPARYDKPEDEGPLPTSLELFSFETDRPLPVIATPAPNPENSPTADGAQAAAPVAGQDPVVAPEAEEPTAAGPTMTPPQMAAEQGAPSIDEGPAPTEGTDPSDQPSGQGTEVPK